MPSYSFNHIALSVKDVNESVEFYQKVLQLKEIENTASVSKTRWLSLNEGKELHLIPRPDFEVRTNKAVHFALSTNDMDSFVKHLRELEIEFSDWHDKPNQVFVRDDGIKQVYFQDPDDYWIEVNNA